MTDERLGHQPTARGSDDPLHREIRRLLAVDPSPAFEASVRARVADEPAPAVWRSARLWAAFGTAAALVLAVAVFRPPPPPDTQVEPAAVVTPTGDAAPASSGAVRLREERPAADRSLAVTAEPTIAPGGRFAGPFPTAAAPGPPRFTRVVFSEGELGALRQILTLARDQPIVFPVSAGARTPFAAGEPPAELVIPPIAIEPAVELAIPSITIEPLNLTLLKTGEGE